MSALARFVVPVAVLFCMHAAKAEFRFRVTQDYGSLDWGHGEVTALIVQQLMEGLTVSGKDGEPRPGLAATWTSKENGFVFKLRKDARWSDGQPVCAQHFVDAWLRVLSPEFASPYAHYLYDLKGARDFHAGRLRDPRKVGVRANGCHELLVDTGVRVGYFPALAGHWVLFPVRVDLIARHGAKWTAPENLAVTGPYLLAEWKPDQAFVLKANPFYYGTAAREKALRGIVVPDDSTAVALFRKNKLDWIKDLPFLERSELAKLKEYRQYPAYVGYHLGFDVSAVSRDQRCALALALNKEQIPGLLRGGEVPAWGLLPPGLASQKRKPNFNPALAKKLWRNYSRPIEVHYYSKDIHVPLMEWVQGQWAKHLGAKIELRRADPKTYWSRLAASPPPVFLSGITAPYAHPYAFFLEFLADTEANWGRFDSGRFDQLALEIRRLPAGRRRADSERQAERVLLDEDCAVIPLYFRNTPSLLSAAWEGLEINPLTLTRLKTVRPKR